MYVYVSITGDIFATVTRAGVVMATVAPNTGVIIPTPYVLSANQTITFDGATTLTSPVPGLHLFKYILSITNTGGVATDFFVGASINGGLITGTTFIANLAAAATATQIGGSILLNLPSPGPNNVQIMIATTVATTMNTAINQWSLVKL